ncbi:adenylate kinase [Candidatus Bathyarchaeota archaeon]|nr:adenylate kinase [Candidatus Bathyarchaeota archaeon]
MKMVIMGPPGSGKGTRAHIISDIYDIPVITTGDMLREAIKDETEYGKVAKEYVEQGDLVPDRVVNGIVRDRMSQPDIKEGFILDGFPRSKSQADALDEILDDLGMELTHVLYVKVPDEVIINRLSKRRTCPECGAVYNLDSAPPEKDEICDKCRAKLVQREDDKPEVIKHRLEVYREKTKPLLERYHEHDLVVEVSGEVSMDKLRSKMKELLN